MTLFVDQTTGEVVEDQIDSLISQWEAAKVMEAQYRAERQAIEDHLAKIALSIPGDGKTRRVAGESRCIKVNLKSETKWDDTKLQDIRQIIGDERFFGLFRIAGYKPNTLEIKKLKNTAGEPEALYHELCKAMIEVQGRPSFEVEK